MILGGETIGTSLVVFVPDGFLILLINFSSLVDLLEDLLDVILVMSMLTFGMFIFMDLLTMEDQLVLESPDLIDLLSEEAWITSELGVLEVLPTILAV